jgi:DNA-binding FadR family transcriptional regulator
MASAGTTLFEKVRATRAHERIVEQLQHLILTGVLEPGSRLPSERALMARFEVSRPTVREALRVAESLGLVSIRHGDPAGPKVLGAPSIGITRVFDGLLAAGRASAIDLLELRLVLDSSAAALASARPKSRLNPAARILRQMRASPDAELCAQLDAAFHEAIISASGNPLFQVVFAALAGPTRALIESRLRSAYSPGPEETLRQHEEILDAIGHGRPRAAAAAARRHLREFYLPGFTPAERRRALALLQALEAGCAPRRDVTARRPTRASRGRR